MPTAERSRTTDGCLTEALRDEVEGFGIQTLIGEPGAFRTRPDAVPMPPTNPPPLPEYDDTTDPTHRYVADGHGSQRGDPAKAAGAILAALDADEPPLRLVLAPDSDRKHRAATR